MQQNGSLIVWHSQDQALAKQFSQHLQRAHQDSSVWRLWHNQEISEHEPQLVGGFQQGLFLPTEGQLDNSQILLALARHGFWKVWLSYGLSLIMIIRKYAMIS